MVNHDPLTEGFVHFHLIKFCMNTHTQYMSVNITILKKGTRVSFRQWDKNDYDLVVTRLRMSHTDGGFGLTPNVIVQTSAKVVMSSRFLGLLGSLPLDEEHL